MNDDFTPAFPGAEQPAAPAGRPYARRLDDL